MKNYVKLSIPIWNVEVICHVGRNDKDLKVYLQRDKVHKTIVDTVFDSEFTKDATTTIFANGIALIRLGKRPKDARWISILSHEVVHVVNNIMKAKGLKLRDSSEEAYSYTHQYIMFNLLKELR